MGIKKLTKKEAKELSLLKWEYLKKYPSTEVWDNFPSELLEKIEDLNSQCGLCELFINQRDKDKKERCEGCPINNADENCFSSTSLYKLFTYACNHNLIEAAKIFAEQIYGILNEWEIEDE